MDLFREVGRLHDDVLKMPASSAASEITSEMERTFNEMLCMAKGQCPGTAAIRSLEPASQAIPLIELAIRLQILRRALSQPK